MRQFEVYFIWGIHFIVLILFNMNLESCLISSVVILIVLFNVKRIRYQEFKSRIKSIRFYNVTNLESKKIRELFYIPALLALLIIVIILEYEIDGKDIWIIFYGLPLMPIIYGWLINVYFSKLSYGLVLQEYFIQVGFDGERFKYAGLKCFRIVGEQIEFEIKDSNKSKVFNLFDKDIQEIKSFLENKGVKQV